MKERGDHLPPSAAAAAAAAAALLVRFVALLLVMAVLAFLPEPASKKETPKRKKKQPPPEKPPSSWYQLKKLLTCKQIENSKVHDPSINSKHQYYSATNICCTFKGVACANTRTRVVHRADNSPDCTTLAQETRLLANNNKISSDSSRTTAHDHGSSSAARSATSTGTRGIQFRKLSGCYECHAIVDPTSSRYPLPRTTICACSECGEVFPRIESLEHHQAVRHAVSELGAEDSSRNIVEIIFKSSWLKKDNAMCKIERILKVHNTQRTIQRFEDYRDAVKIRATTNAKRNARCAADGNELLRFHCATLTCSLGARGSSSLCASIPACGVCTLIRHGFQGAKITGIRTTASSGRAHDCLGIGIGKGASMRRAMLVCRVIAGRVKHPVEDAPADDSIGVAPTLAASRSYDSLAGCAGVYSSMEELRVFSSRAILPCFVVIYQALES